MFDRLQFLIALISLHSSKSFISQGHAIMSFFKTECWANMLNLKLIWPYLYTTEYQFLHFTGWSVMTHWKWVNLVELPFYTCCCGCVNTCKHSMHHWQAVSTYGLSPTIYKACLVFTGLVQLMLSTINALNKRGTFRNYNNDLHIKN